MYKRAQSTQKLPVHSAKGFANFSASLAMLPPTCLFLSELMELFVAGRDQSAADQPNNLAEGHPPLQPL
jgi:hypothetical protein